MARIIFSALIFILSLFFHGKTYAATSITTPSVSGHWTISGSPYLIFNDILVDGPQSLKIDPGVQVIFQGAYQLVVVGIISAVGTSTHPINFTINDTTGWSTDSATAQGGWHGINLAFYEGTIADSSSMRYCNISRTKFCSPDYFLGVNTLAINRYISIKNCNFFDNKTNNDAPINLFLTHDSCEISGCGFYNNICDKSLIFISASANYNNNKIYNNRVLTDVVYVSFANILFSNNEISNNTETGGVSGCSPLHIDACIHATLAGNSIHHNLSYGEGAVILSGGGFIDLVGNLICNNNAFSTGAGCGAVDGGGGVTLTCDGCAPGSYSYAVRNNVIANNNCNIEGGAIKIFHASGFIANNQIVNNVSSAGGGMYLLLSSADSLVIKNNIFYRNVTLPLAYSIFCSVNGVCDSGCKIEYDHNWSSQPYYSDMGCLTGLITFSGDTGTNLSDSIPGLIAPTLTADPAENAVTANFGLLPTSPCIDKGDTSGAYPDSIDYAHNSRIYNSIIDIGAYEYAPPHPIDTTSGITNLISNGTTLIAYPNPASNIIFISLPEAKGTIQLQDIFGRQVIEKKVTNTIMPFDLHAMSRGIYFATWNDGNGTKATKKIVLE